MRQTWEQTANRALEQAGREARIDHRSLADRRDAAERDGDLNRAAELSREPNMFTWARPGIARAAAPRRGKSVSRRGAWSERLRRTPPSGTPPGGRWRA